jgi:cytochrome c oxidase assembly protein subunit 15
VSADARLRGWSLALLGVTVLVILWGAFVRVTGSGAGCADHWPLCNGELLPRAPRLETVIELTHRVTSGLAGLLSLGVTWLALRTPRGSPVRGAALGALVLMLVEGAIGALLVKKGLVDKDASQARALVVGLHLGNTFLLLAAQLLTLHFASGGGRLAVRARPGLALTFLGLLMLVLLVGSSGAVTALGDTLFPAQSLAAGMRDDFAEGAHFLVRLRVWHPVLALATGAVVTYAAQSLRSASDDPQVARWALWVIGAFILQVALGSLNLVLLAPAWLQVLHLLLADVLWLALVQLSLVALSAPRTSSVSAAALA